MIAELLLLGPAILGGACLGLAGFGPRVRTVLVSTISAAGVAGGLSLAWLAQSGAWRTTALEDAPALGPAGFAVAGAWALVAVLDLGRGRWDIAALVGIASTGLLLFAANQWAVPGLLFWLCSSVALIALAAHSRGGTWVWVAILLSDAALVAGLAWNFSLTEGWAMPAPVASTGPLYLLVAAAVLRPGIVPGVGAWQTLGSRAAPALPLLVGGPFVLLAGPAARPDPWTALSVLLFSAIVGAAVVGGRNGGVSATGAWFMGLMVGAAIVAPQTADTAGIGAVLTAVVVALWPFSYGRGRAARGVLLASLPATAGFPAVASAAAVAFERAVPVAGNGPISWILVAGVLLVGVGIGVALGARVANQRRPDSFEPSATIATWCVGAVSVGIGVGVSAEVLRLSGGATTLLAVAVLAGAAIAIAAASRVDSPRVAPGADFELGLVAPGPRVEIALAGVAGLLALLVVVGAASLTIQGLRVGFL